MPGHKLQHQKIGERIVLKRRTDGLYDPARGTTAHQEHLKLLAAIERRDTAEAVVLGRSDIQAGKKNVMTDLKQRLAIREIRPGIKRSHFAGGDLTPPLTKGDARPLWKPHLIVPASRGGVNVESNKLGAGKH